MDRKLRLSLMDVLALGGRVAGTLADSTFNSDYIQIRSPVYISHSAGRYAVKRFRKANCPIIERLTNSLMMNGRNNGKKLMAVRIVAHAFEIVSMPFSSYLLGFTVTPNTSPRVLLTSDLSLRST